MKDLRLYMPVIFTFIMLVAIIFTFTPQFEKASVAPNVLMGGNLLLFVVTIATIAFQKKSLSNANPNVFIRSIMTGMLLKMVIGAAAVLIYVQMNPDTYSRYGIFGAMIFYLVYLSVEVYVVMKLNRKKNA